MSPVVRAAVLMIVVSLALPARGQGSAQFSIYVSNELTSVLIDRGHTVVDIALDTFSGVRFRCDGHTVQRTDFDITVTVDLESGDPGETLCRRYAEVDVGRLDTGRYAIRANVLMDGAAVATLNAMAHVVAQANQCNAFPRDDEIVATPVGQSPEAFVASFNNDPVYRSRFGDIGSARVYPYASGQVALRLPPLSDPIVESDAVERTGELTHPAIPHSLCDYLAPQSPVVIVAEFHDTVHDRYFVTADAAEQAAIDAGRAGPGWVRTGSTFRAFADAHQCGPALTVFRFTSSLLRPADIHFFTSDVRECAIVRDTDWVWRFEGIAFAALSLPRDGCPIITLNTFETVQTAALYRAYNAGKGGEPNHRLAIDHALIDAMVAQGWVDEGPVMCVLPP